MQNTGRVTVKINGDTLRSRPGGVTLDDYMRAMWVRHGATEAVDNDQGGIDYRESTQAGGVSCTLVHVSSTDLEALRNFRDGVVNYETDTGKVYVIPGAFMTELGELSEGTVDVTFMGQPAEEA